MILITGANGHLGRRLIAALAGTPVRAVVRSEKAAALVGAPHVDVRIIDYLDRAAMTAAAEGCQQIVHLVGIIRESATSTFQAAHEDTTAVLREAAAGAGTRQVVYLSILGAGADAPNACLASKGRAESLLRSGSVPSLVLRVPMVLGEGDHASRALGARARRRVDVQFRAGSLEQPIYAGDVIGAVVRVLDRVGEEHRLLELAGPESLTRAALVQRAARVLGLHPPRVISLPVGLGMALAGVLERCTRNPPITRAMLGVLDHDDRIDPGPALEALGLTLTPLDEALRRCLAGPAPGSV